MWLLLLCLVVNGCSDREQMAATVLLFPVWLALLNWVWTKIEGVFYGRKRT